MLKAAQVNREGVDSEMLATAAEQFHGRVISDHGERALLALEALHRGEDVPLATLDQAIAGVDDLVGVLKTIERGGRQLESGTTSPRLLSGA